MPKYRYVGTVATEVAVGNKAVPVGPGDFVTLSAEEAKSAGDKFVEVKPKGGEK